MATFSQWKEAFVREHEEEGWNLPRAMDTIEKSPILQEKTEAFFAAHNFDDVEEYGRGGASAVLQDKTNPELFFRIAPLSDTRAVVPHSIQPLHVEIIEDETTFTGVKIEFLRNLDRYQVSSDDFHDLCEAYVRDARKSGYELDAYEGSALKKDMGIFTYDDPKAPGKRKAVAMATDASLVYVPDAGKPPTCTEHYPTLEVQWREQCRMVNEDERLQKLIGTPAKLPVTKVIGERARA